MRARSSLLAGAVLGALAPAPAEALPPGTSYDVVLGQANKGQRRINFTDDQGLSQPMELAIDVSHTPNHLYLADMNNGRVLAWRDASQFKSGAVPDLIIGQPDRYTSEWYRKDARSISGPSGLAVDPQGTLWVADLSNGRVLGFRWPFDPGKSAEERATADVVLGQPDFAAGYLERGCNGGNLFGAGQGYAQDNTFCNPAGLTTDPAGNLYVTDTANSRVVMYSAPIAETGARAARIFGQDAPKACTINADCGTAAMACVSSVCRYTVPNSACNKGSTADANSLCRPQGAFAHQDGGVLRLYVADAGNNRVVVYDDPLQSRTAARVFGQPAMTTTAKGIGPDKLNNPLGVSVDPQGVVWIADGGNNRMLGFVPPFYGSIGPGVSLVIGQLDASGAQANEGLAGKAVPPPTGATLYAARRATFDGAGRMLLPDTSNHRVLVYTSYASTAPSATAVFGQPSLRHNGENFVQSQGLALPVGVAVDRPDPASRPGEPMHVYVADHLNSRVLGWWDLGGLIDGKPADLVIGQRTMNDSVCNTGQRVSGRTLCWPRAVTVDKNGDLWVADTWNHRVLRFPRPFSGPRFPEADLVLGQTDMLSALPNQNGGKVPSAASLWHPSAVTIAEDGVVWVADRDNDRVLGYVAPYKSGMDAGRLLIGGGITTFDKAGCATRPSGSSVCGPAGLALDAGGNLWVAERDNNRVALYGTTPAAGAVLSQTALAILGQPNQMTVAANGGTPSATSLRQPEAVSVELARKGDGSLQANAIVVADSGNHRVLAYAPTTSAFQPAATAVYGQNGAFDTRLANLDSVNTEAQATVAKGLWNPAGVLALPEVLIISDSGGSAQFSTRANNVQPGLNGTGNHRVLFIKGPGFPAPSPNAWQPPGESTEGELDMLPPEEALDMRRDGGDLGAQADLGGGEEPGGCSCRVGGGATEPALPMLAGLILGAALLRRRRK